MEENEGQHENGVHVVKDSDRQQRLRLCVLNEILNTERDYVRTLLFLQSVSLTFTPQSLSVALGADIHFPLSATQRHKLLPTRGAALTTLVSASPL